MHLYFLLQSHELLLQLPLVIEEVYMYVCVCIYIYIYIFFFFLLCRVACGILVP